MSKSLIKQSPIKKRDNTRATVIGLGRSNDLTCGILVSVPVLGIIIASVISAINRHDIDWQGSILLIVVGLLIVIGLGFMIYRNFFAKRQLVIDRYDILGLQKEPLALQQVAALEQVTIAANPYRLVLHTLVGRAFLIETPNQATVDQCVKSLIDRGVPLEEHQVRRGTQIELSTGLVGAAMVGATPVFRGAFSQHDVHRAWQRSDRPVDHLIQEVQQVGYTEHTVNQTVRLVLPAKGSVESKQPPTVLPPHPLTPPPLNMPPWLWLSLKLVMWFVALFVGYSFLLVLLIVFSVPLPLVAVLFIVSTFYWYRKTIRSLS